MNPLFAVGQTVFFLAPKAPYKIIEAKVFHIFSGSPLIEVRSENGAHFIVKDDLYLSEFTCYESSLVKLRHKIDRQDQEFDTMHNNWSQMFRLSFDTDYADREDSMQPFVTVEFLDKNGFPSNRGKGLKAKYRKESIVKHVNRFGASLFWIEHIKFYEHDATFRYYGYRNSISTQTGTLDYFHLEKEEDLLPIHPIEDAELLDSIPTFLQLISELPKEQYKSKSKAEDIGTFTLLSKLRINDPLNTDIRSDLIDLENLKRFNIFLGANGSGKSWILSEIYNYLAQYLMKYPKSNFHVSTINLNCLSSDSIRFSMKWLLDSNYNGMFGKEEISCLLNELNKNVPDYSTSYNIFNYSKYAMLYFEYITNIFKDKTHIIIMDAPTARMNQDCHYTFMWQMLYAPSNCQFFISASESYLPCYLYERASDITYFIMSKAYSDEYNGRIRIAQMSEKQVLTMYDLWNIAYYNIDHFVPAEWRAEDQKAIEVNRN